MHRVIDLISKVSAFHRFDSSDRFHTVLGMKTFTGLTVLIDFVEFWELQLSQVS